MRWCSATLAVGLLQAPIGLSAVGEPPSVKNQVVTASWADLDANGQNDSIEIVAVRAYLEQLDGFGPQFVGQFAARIALNGGRPKDTRLNPFFSPDEPDRDLSLCARPWSLHLRDYDGDGRFDFNLGIWGGSNGNLYRLFGIEPDGGVQAFRVPNDELFVAAHANSTRDIHVVHGTLRWAWYANFCDRDSECGWYVNEARWEPADRAFARVGSHHVADGIARRLITDTRSWCE